MSIVHIVSRTFTTWLFLSANGIHKTKVVNTICGDQPSYPLMYVIPYALSHFRMIVYHFSSALMICDNVCESIRQIDTV